MIVVTIIKKLFKLFLVAILIMTGYVGYMVYNGEKIPTNSKEIMNHLEKKKENLKIDALKEKGKAAAKEAVKESL